jgi:hypothetical protein
MQTILGISGPPRSGKDSIARIICELEHSAITRRMSAPLKMIAMQYLPLQQRPGLESRKDESLNHLGTTYRDLQIGTWLMGRDLLGEDWLGTHFLDSIKYCPFSLILVPDFGRLSEVMVLIHAGHRVLQIKVSRPGTSFEGDSREDFTLPGPSNSLSFVNAGSIEDLRRNVVDQIMPWLAAALRAPSRPSLETEREGAKAEEPING